MEVVELAAARRSRRTGRSHGARRAGRRRRPAERVDAGHRRRLPGRPGVDGRPARAAFSSARKWSGVSFGEHGNWVRRRTRDAAAGRRRRGLGAGRSSGPSGAARAPARSLRASRWTRRTHRPRSSRWPSSCWPRRSDPTAPRRWRTSVSRASPSRSSPVTTHAPSVPSPSARTGHGRSPGRRPQPRRRLVRSPAAVANGSVFGRVTPHQKRAMVGALQVGRPHGGDDRRRRQRRAGAQGRRRRRGDGVGLGGHAVGGPARPARQPLRRAARTWSPRAARSSATSSGSPSCS